MATEPQYAWSPWFAGDYIDMVAVTPADGSDLPNGLARGLYIGGTAGNVVVVTAAGSTVTVAVQQFQTLRVQVARVRSTSTTATGIFACY